MSSYSANLTPSDWSGKFAGIGDLVDGGYCKHEIAAICYFEKQKEAGLPPADFGVPNNLRLEKTNRTFSLNKAPSLGDYFGF